ncbi:hypothetical protein AX774_g1519 [Zancudomyces culisetae]|uniref:Uncharacterized protein n=1 Tax=Zancudomyces culisetae TaxID=1213189 RepID=A0A1R1PVE9_ZANCU|nr:hypothetical protein AX774_g1519 [Zancudomyces culisetae]|eukprot:OMH84945.1 hypothetical protein AX774_g1519 [Zancudomyces culisetae]
MRHREGGSKSWEVEGTGNLGEHGFLDEWKADLMGDEKDRARAAGYNVGTNGVEEKAGGRSGSNCGNRKQR